MLLYRLLPKVFVRCHFLTPRQRESKSLAMMFQFGHRNISRRLLRNNDSSKQRVFSSSIARNFPAYVNSALNKPKPTRRNIHNDSYHDPPDYVNQLAPFDPQMAYWQMMRT